MTDSRFTRSLERKCKRCRRMVTGGFMDTNHDQSCPYATAAYYACQYSLGDPEKRQLDDLMIAQRYLLHANARDKNHLSWIGFGYVLWMMDGYYRNGPNKAFLAYQEKLRTYLDHYK